jgi:hypothetical protein
VRAMRTVATSPILVRYEVLCDRDTSTYAEPHHAYASVLKQLLPSHVHLVHHRHHDASISISVFRLVCFYILYASTLDTTLKQPSIDFRLPGDTYTVVTEEHLLISTSLEGAHTTMNASHSSSDQDANPLVEERASTPPPPYELEDPTPQVFHSSHDPEYVDLDADVPYSVRGW